MADGGDADSGPAAALPRPAEAREKSRSQKKRESSALQQYGQALSGLSPAILQKLPLPPELAEALSLWPRLKSREAKRRHMQYIGRLMRDLDDPSALEAALREAERETLSRELAGAPLRGLRESPGESA